MVALLLPVVAGCQPSALGDARLAAPEDTLRAVVVLHPEIPWGSISFLRVFSDHLFVTDRFADPRVFVLDWQTGELVQKFGRFGRGPAEFLDPGWVTLGPPGADELWIYDYQQRKFVRVCRGEASAYEPLEELRLATPYAASQPIWTEDGILTNGYFPDQTLFLLDHQGRPLRWVVRGSPFTQSEMPDLVGRIQLNRNRLALNPLTRRFALAYQSVNRIDFYDADGVLVVSTHGPRPAVPSYHVAPGRDSPPQLRWQSGNQWAYVSVDGSERHVFALFCGDRCPEHTDYPTLLHVFNWDGTFLQELALDRPVKMIGVTPDEESLIGVVEDPVPAIVRWSLRGALR